MDWIQLLTIVGSNIALFVWARTEANQDRRDMGAKLDASLKSIAEEMKDFHGRLERQDAEFKNRLLVIEEKIRNKVLGG